MYKPGFENFSMHQFFYSRSFADSQPLDIYEIMIAH